MDSFSEYWSVLLYLLSEIKAAYILQCLMFLACVDSDTDNFV